MVAFHARRLHEELRGVRGGSLVFIGEGGVREGVVLGVPKNEGLSSCRPVLCGTE